MRIPALFTLGQALGEQPAKMNEYASPRPHADFAVNFGGRPPFVVEYYNDLIAHGRYSHFQDPTLTSARAAMTVRRTGSVISSLMTPS